MSQNKLLLSTNSGLHSARPNAPRIPMEETLDFIAGAGFEGVDVNFCAVIQEGELAHEPILDGEDWRRRVEGLRERAEKNCLQIPFTHSPFRYNYLDRDTPEFARCDGMMRRSLEAAGLLGAGWAVVHPVSAPDRSHTLVEESVRGLEPLAGYARQFGVRLAVENMTSTGPEELLAIAEAIDADICWDVGHAHIRGLDQQASLAALGGRVKALHLHDNYGSRGRALSEAPKCDLHQPPHFGNLDWDGVLRGLAQAGYTGAFNYEVSCGRLPETLRGEMARYLVRAARELLERFDAL